MTEAELIALLRAATAADRVEVTAPPAGVWDVLRVFCRERPEWSVVSVDPVVVSRRAEDKKRPPAAWARALRFAGYKVREWYRGRRLVPLAVYEERLDACAVCPERADAVCARCGCHLDKIPDDSPVTPGGPGKAMLASERCPLSVWGAWPDRTNSSSSRGASGTA